MKKALIALVLVVAACGPSESQRHFSRGQALYDVRQFRAAEFEFSVAYTLAPSNSEARRRRDAAALEAENYEAGQFLARSIRNSNAAHR